MTLPTYDKTKRRKSFERLPKGAYVIQIKGVKQEKNRKGDGEYLKIAFDIAEGDYAGIYSSQFENSTNEDKKWPNDATYYLNIPQDNSPEFIHTNWNTFFADLEDSNGGFVFDGTVSKLKGKKIGGKFAIEETEYNGRIYEHTRMRWTCVAEDVRNGKAGQLPQDKRIERKTAPAADDGEFMQIPDGAEDELPF